MRHIAKGLIRIYQKVISPFIIKSCRFEPSCSQYALEAYEVHGFAVGTVKTVWRILRCNPFSPGGYDPVIKQKQ